MPDLKSMKMTKADREDQYPKASASVDEPSYPYGLTLHLDDAVIKKLGLGDMPDAGDNIVVLAKATVSSVSENEQAGGGKRRSMSIQITDLGIGAESDAKKASEKLYGE